MEDYDDYDEYDLVQRIPFLFFTIGASALVMMIRMARRVIMVVMMMKRRPMMMLNINIWYDPSPNNFAKVAFLVLLFPKVNY